MSSPALAKLRDRTLASTTKFGFIVYRCSYGDDEKWARLMTYLTKSTQMRLEEEGLGDVFEHLDWNVQEDPSWANFGSSDVKTIRKKFRKWITSEAETDDCSSRFHACIMATDIIVSTVVENERPAEEYDALGRSYVYLVSKYAGEGYTAIGISYVVPRAYSLIATVGWEGILKEGERVAKP